MCNDRQRAGAGRCAPEILGVLAIGNGDAAALRAHAHELPREFADQVAARESTSEAEPLSGRVGIVDRDADLVEMGVRIERDDAIANRRGSGGRQWGPWRRSGAPNTNRTCDLSLRRGLLYPLSYRGCARDFTGSVILIAT